MSEFSIEASKAPFDKGSGTSGISGGPSGTFDIDLEAAGFYPDWGIKRQCRTPSCKTVFYDRHAEEVVCPVCHKVLELEKSLKIRSQRIGLDASEEGASMKETEIDGASGDMAAQEAVEPEKDHLFIESDEDEAEEIPVKKPVRVASPDEPEDT